MKCKTLKKIAAFALAFGALAQPAWADDVWTVTNYRNGKCLDIRDQDNPYNNYARIQQWNCSGAWEQEWYLEPIGSSGQYFKLRNPWNGKCMRVRDASPDDGAQVDQFDCPAIGGLEFTWRLVPMGNYDMLVNEAGQRCLTVSGGSSANGAMIQQWACNGTTAQQWQFHWKYSD